MMSRTRLARRSILALCCLSALSACTAWEEQSAPAPGREIGAVRLTLNDGYSIVLKNAVLTGDSIVGWPPHTTRQTAVALANVKKSEIQRVDPASTFWTAFLGAAAGFAGFMYVMLPRT